MARQNDYDPAQEFATIAYLSGRHDAIAEIEDARENEAQAVQERIVAASRNDKVSAFWKDAGWQDSGGFFGDDDEGDDEGAERYDDEAEGYDDEGEGW